MTLSIKLFRRDVVNEIPFCKSLLNSFKESISNVKLSIFEDYPNESQGKLLISINLKELPANIYEFIQRNNKNFKGLFDLIYQFDFVFIYRDITFDGYLRINNDFLSKYFGNFEMDIFPKGNIYSFGDFINKENLWELITLIENWIIEISKVYKIGISQAFLGVSDDFLSDVSKRIFLYYRYPKDFLVDVIKFIKNIQELEAPEYLRKEYMPVFKKLIPYDENFVAKEFFSSKKFVDYFDNFTKENAIEVTMGSLLMNTKGVDKTFLLIRTLSEKTIFPVMKTVTGADEFKKTIDSKLEELR